MRQTPSPTGNVVGSLFQVFFKSGATTFRIAVKLQQPFGQASIVQTEIGQEIVQDGAIFMGSKEVRKVQSVPCQASSRSPRKANR